jgi:hypothetical protein
MNIVCAEMHSCSKENVKSFRITQNLKVQKTGIITAVESPLHRYKTKGAIEGVPYEQKCTA